MIRPIASVLIPVQDDVPGLLTTLQSLRDAGIANRDCEVIVCNDGGPSEVGEAAVRFGAHEVRLPTNGGSYAARNAGLVAARGEAIVFLDADQEVDAQWLHEGLAALETCDYVGGRIQVVGNGSDAWERFDARHGFNVAYDLESLGFAPTANLFVRRAMVASVGPFHCCLRSGADREFGVRVRAMGFIQGYAPLAITRHPARARDAQRAKLWRTGAGYAELAIGIWDRPAAIVASAALGKAAIVPLELAWRLLSGGAEEDRIAKQNKARYQLAVARRALRWLGGEKLKNREHCPACTSAAEKAEP